MSDGLLGNKTDKLNVVFASKEGKKIRQNFFCRIKISELKRRTINNSMNWRWEIRYRKIS